MKPRIRAYSKEYWINLYRMQPDTLCAFPLDAKMLVINFLQDKEVLKEFIKKPVKKSNYHEPIYLLERRSNY